MKTLLIAAVTVSTVLGAGVATAQPYYDNWDHRGGYDRGWHDRDHDRDWRDWRWRDDWRWRHRHHYGYGYYYGHRVCSWRYGEQVCWYQR